MTGSSLSKRRLDVGLGLAHRFYKTKLIALNLRNRAGASFSR